MKINGHYQKQPPQRTAQGTVKLDRWGNPLCTDYLKVKKTQDEDRIRKKMTDFCRGMTKLAEESGWSEVQSTLGCDERKLPLIGNDPLRYTLEDIITEMEDHLTKPYKGSHKDITRSFIDRYNYIIDQMILSGHVDLDNIEEFYEQHHIDIIEPQQNGVNFGKYFTVT